MKSKEQFLKEVLETVADAKEAVASLKDVDPDVVVRVELPEFRSLDAPARGCAVPLLHLGGRV